MMCRAVGINARIASGYHGGEFNSVGGFYLVREKDAHSWVEVFLPERGWTIFDPTPSAPASSKSSEIGHWMHDISEWLQSAWLSTVVAFDNTTRKYIFTSVSHMVNSVGEWIKTCVHEIVDSMRELLFGASSPLELRLLGFTSVAVFVGMIGWLVNRWQRRRTSQLPLILILKTVDRKVQRQLAYDLAFFDDLLRLLGRRLRKKQLEETPREYVESLSAELGKPLENARWLIGVFYDIRFGAIHVNFTMRTRIAEALHNLKNELQN